MFDDLPLTKNIMFINTHSNYGQSYFSLQGNVIVCFLTGANKYGYIDYKDKTHKFIENNEEVFNNIFKYKSKYVYEEFNCFINELYIGLDYFRDSAWYYPGQQCPNSMLAIKEIDNLKYKNIKIIEEGNYQLINVTQKTPFQKPLNLFLQDKVEPGKKYIVISAGCRLIEPSNFENDNQLNFMNFHINYQISQEILKAQPPPIEDYIVSLKPVISINYSHTPSDLILLGRTVKYNAFSHNNHNINMLLTKINSGSPDSSFIDKVSIYQNTLNFDKNLLFCQKVKDLGIRKKIFNNKFINSKYHFIDSILTKLKIEINRERMNELNASIFISLFQKLINIDTLLQLVNGNTEEIIHTSRDFNGINYLNSNIIVPGPMKHITKETAIIFNILKENTASVLQNINSSGIVKNLFFINCIFNKPEHKFIKIYNTMVFKDSKLWNSSLNIRCEELYIYNSNITNIVFENIKRITIINFFYKNLCFNNSFLEELYLEYNQHGEQLLTFNTPNLKKLTLVSLKKRDIYYIIFKNTFQNIQSLDSLILSNLEIFQESKIEFSVFQNITKIELDNVKFLYSQNSNEISTPFDFSKCPKLKKIKLLNLEENIDFSTLLFPKIEYITIINVPKLIVKQEDIIKADSLIESGQLTFSCDSISNPELEELSF